MKPDQAGAGSIDDPHRETISILNALLDWAAFMGGFESAVWNEARDYRDSLLKE